MLIPTPLNEKSGIINDFSYFDVIEKTDLDLNIENEYSKKNKKYSKKIFFK